MNRYKKASDLWPEFDIPQALVNIISFLQDIEHRYNVECNTNITRKQANEIPALIKDLKALSTPPVTSVEESSSNCRRCGKDADLTNEDAGTDRELKRLCNDCYYTPYQFVEDAAREYFDGLDGGGSLYHMILDAVKYGYSLQSSNAMQHPAKDEGVIKELERRQALIISEPNGQVRETMIQNLLIDLPSPLQPSSIDFSKFESGDRINFFLSNILRLLLSTEEMQVLSKNIQERLPQPSSNVGEGMKNPADKYWFDHVVPRKKVLDMLEENMNAGLTDEDAARDQRELLKETYQDIIEIIKTM